MIRLVAAGAAAATLAAVTYRTLLRRACLNWGATAEEAARRLPGDELLEQTPTSSRRGRPR